MIACVNRCCVQYPELSELNEFSENFVLFFNAVYELLLMI